MVGVLAKLLLLRVRNV